MAFQDTSNKATVRREWDLPILTSYADEVGRRLAYFGLPGEQIKDLIDWRDVLGYRTGVEIIGQPGKKREEELRLIHRLQTNVMIHGLGSDWQLLRGSVEDILLEGYDLDGTPPARNGGEVPLRRLYRYDLYNLDFTGGIGYADMRGESKRVRAIRKLFERQTGNDFLLLLTVNVRDTLGTELSTYLREESKEYHDQKLQATLSWYADVGRGMKKYKLKAALPSCFQEFARHSYFNCFCYPPLAYYGHKAYMVHFVFKLTFVPGRNFPVARQQKVEELLNMPLVEVEDGKILVAQKQHPGFDYSQCSQYLSFLPEHIRDGALPQAEM